MIIAHSYLIYDVDVAIKCRQVVSEDRGVSNVEDLEQNDNSLFNSDLGSKNRSGITEMNKNKIIVLLVSDCQGSSYMVYTRD